ncbi:hypothetical protein QN277_019027 [Acacia crassicarpa]|uniref:Pentatricopeptide repeat-containing protein n=1 Tax=Acacia crassicarpa TaxID=499986 RepID=A0AAE1JVS3_9FABA|nr:hypothetical protein QN277_019027 [Acacia crassicarpa]
MPSLRRLKCISVLYSLPKPSSHIQQIHAQLVINGLKSPPLLAKLIEHYCGSSNQRIVNHAHLVFQYTDKHDIFLFNTLVRCCQPKDSILIFQSEFARGDMVFDDYTYIFILGACARFPSAATLMLGTQLHARIVKHGVTSNIMVPTTGIHFYASNKDVASARRVFDEMAERSSVTWNAMITGYSSQKEGNKQHARPALLLFRDMLADESWVKPTDTTMLCVISAASQLGMLATGASLHGFAEKTVRVPEDDVYIGTGLVDMYSKCGMS